MDLQALASRLLKLNTRQFTPEAVLELMEAHELPARSFEKYLHYDAGQYTRNLVCKNEIFEMLVLCWDPGQATMIHDHAEQGCWMTVLDGVITSENYAFVSARDFNGELEKTPSKSFKRGQSYFIDDTIALHLLKNPVKSGEKTATLHIYSKPFSSCTIYDLDKKETRELKLMYHSLGGDRGSWFASEIKSFSC